ncbi:DNA-formamidopyrimidine glycosylase family protein [Salinimicrobium catena]|uniref:Fpg/Nei family DNA glycosylase n=1 Tax=Salinimicrobium catena TaxID=390640 RepID=UPI002FE43DBD
MPELPEIAFNKKYVDATALHKKITQLSFPDDSLLQAPKSHFDKALKGEELEETTRLGKYLLIKISSGKWLVFHFGMTGKLVYYQNQETPKYTKMLLSFDNDYHLAYSCRRKLGKIYLAEGFEEFKKENELGDDALELSEKQFLNLLTDKSGSIKGALTDQHLLSGIGNVYSDEMLYQCGIHPKSKVDKLSEAEKKQLYKQMKKVLKMAIDKEGERSEFPSDYLINHRKDGEDCPKCSGKIKQIKVSGRSTYFCPSCQKEQK